MERQEKQMKKFAKNAKHPLSLGSFCPNLGKNEFSTKTSCKKSENY